MKDSRPPTIPQCCPAHRIEALDVLDVVIANDVLANYDEMSRAGWPRDAAIDALGTYRAWMLDRVGAAVDFGLGLLDLEVVA